MYEELMKRLRKRAVNLKEKFSRNAELLLELTEAADAIEELAKDLERSKEYETFWNKEAEEALRRFQVAVDNKPRWIPVTERLPDCFDGEEIGNVEWISHGTVYAGCFGRGGKWRDAYFRTWNDDTEGIDAYDAECWRIVTLPEPPKEET